MRLGKSNHPDLFRRALLKVLFAIGIVPSAIAAPPERQRPKIGDRLVYGAGDAANQPILEADLEPGARPVIAYPMEPATAIVRSGSRLNKVMVMRVDETALTPKARRYAPDGVVAYSSVCTHTGCDVHNWNETEKRMVCTCHGSEFDVFDAARVILGPAPKPLAMLPVEVVDGELVVNGKFSRRVGFQQPF